MGVRSVSLRICSVLPNQGKMLWKIAGVRGETTDSQLITIYVLKLVFHECLWIINEGSKSFEILRAGSAVSMSDFYRTWHQSIWQCFPNRLVADWPTSPKTFYLPLRRLQQVLGVWQRGLGSLPSGIVPIILSQKFYQGRNGCKSHCLVRLLF